MPDPGRRTFPLKVFGSKVPTAPCGVGRILNIAWRPHRTHQGLSLGCHLPSPQPPTQREVQSLPRSRPQAETAARCTEGTRMPPPPPHREGGHAHCHCPPGAQQLPCHRPAGLLVRRNTRTQQSRAPQTVPASLAARTGQGLGRLTSCFPSSCCLPLQAGLAVSPRARLPFLWLTSSLPTPCAGNAAGLVSSVFSFPATFSLSRLMSYLQGEQPESLAESPTRTWLAVTFGTQTRDTLRRISHRDSLVGTLFTRMVPTPPGWVGFSVSFCFFFPLGFFMLHPYLYLYLICFTFKCIMANVQIFLLIMC